MARYNNYSYWDYLSYFSFPIHFSFFIIIILFVLGLTWYLNYESKVEDLMNQVKLFIMISPVIILLIVHCISNGFPFLVPLPEREALHRAGGSPWGVAALLIFLIFMVSYQSSFHEKWFPLITKY